MRHATLPVGGLLLLGCALAGPAGPETERVCPDFTLTDLDGRPYRLYAELRERPALLWMTNLCAGCQAKIPFVDRLHATFRDRLAVFAISVLGDDRDTPARIRDERRPTFPLLLDPHDWVGTYLGFPHAGNLCPLNNAILVRRNGSIAWRGHLSAASEEEVEGAVRALLAEGTRAGR
ncbi:MAG: redoxin domain-containing protein [bacterium]